MHLYITDDIYFSGGAVYCTQTAHWISVEYRSFSVPLSPVSDGSAVWITTNSTSAQQVLFPTRPGRTT